MEEGGERWSKPHVATLSLHALFELRRGLSTGTVMLDADAANIAQVAGAPVLLAYYYYYQGRRESQRGPRGKHSRGARLERIFLTFCFSE